MARRRQEEPPDHAPAHAQTGTASSRAGELRQAVRRQTFGRMALSGPSGAGKTWTALSMAEVLAPDGPVVLVDTEFDSAELYADRFAFQVITWAPPYDPRDLAITVRELATGACSGGVLIIDSASHFWRGPGGTLDIADGRFGGWKTATPAQDDLVEAILRAPCHVIACTRAKQTYQVETADGGKQEVKKLGLAPIQRDDLEYEFTVVAMIDMEHRIDVGKTRCPDLAGKSYSANHQADLAEAFAEWLQGGEPLARQGDLDAIRDLMRTLPGTPEERVLFAEELHRRFGPADRLTAAQSAEVLELVKAKVVSPADPPPASPQPPPQAGDNGAAAETHACPNCDTTWETEDALQTHREAAHPAPGPEPEPEPDGAQALLAESS